MSPICGIYKVELIKARVDDVYHGLGGGENGKMLVLEKKICYAEWINSGDLLHSIMTTVYNVAFDIWYTPNVAFDIYLIFAKRIDLKCSHHKQKNTVYMWGHGYAN